ncbi:MAG: DegV family protein, partial [Eggerthellaceae bacterium]|nr:DegV family protein [Eggerthellaceae bacterium]
MAETYQLIIDSCCELPREFWDRPDITMLHFTYQDGEESHVDDLFESVTAHEFYESIRKGATPFTSQPSQAEFEDAFQAALDAGKDAVYLAFSSGISGAYEGACVARDRVMERRQTSHPRIYVLDLKIGCTPQSLLIAEAIRHMDRGLTAEELVSWAEEARYYVQTIFMVDDLDALRRGGRIPAGVAYAGAKLDVKPLLSFDIDGKLTMVGVARGRKKGMRAMADFYKKAHDPHGVAQVGIGNADCPRDAERMSVLVREIDPNAMILRTNIGTTIGCHVGPGMISCCFWGSDRRENLSVSDRIARKI